MSPYEELIDELSALCGIVPEYWDIFGERHITSTETKKKLLRAMGKRVDSVEDLVREIGIRKSYPWNGFLEPVHVFSINASLSVPVFIPANPGEEALIRVSWKITDEMGKEDVFGLYEVGVSVVEERWLEGQRYVKVQLSDDSPRDIGYYQLVVNCIHPRKIFEGVTETIQKESKIIVTPEAAYVPPKLEERKSWGLSVNLYSLHSRGSQGIGDFSDLQNVVEGVARMNGDCVAINPLHAIPNSSPYGISPYSPISRLYRNFIYLDLQRISELNEAGLFDQFGEEISRLNSDKLIEYDKVASLKKHILRRLFDLFFDRELNSDSPRAARFREYVKREGSALEYFSIFMSLHEWMQEAHNAHIWQQWPEEYWNSSGEAVTAFKEGREKEILFYSYLQWLLEEQLEQISAAAKEKGMGIGLCNDLAIGSHSGGSDAWARRGVLVEGVSTGAPPDDFSAEGQDWGFPPMSPEALKNTGYSLFIETMNKNMRHAGALRIDHALGMFRLFWIPEGTPPRDGAYVEYPAEDLLRITALESVRNRTLIIAEDLGTVGENVRDELKKFRMFSYRLFYFERNYPEPSFKHPDEYPELALCAITTHDLPTIYGYWQGRDIEVKKELGKLAGEELLQRQLDERDRDRKLICDVLREQKILISGCNTGKKPAPDMTPDLCLAIYRYLACAKCKLLLVSLDDIMGTQDQQNMPGTVDSYPNWRRKTPLSLEEILHDRRFADLSSMLAKERRGD